ncbi:MAG: helix-turn-helix domain-containing protein [Candidatus Bathyarchaeia archaeon]
MFEVRFSVRPKNCWACEISEKFPDMLMQVITFNRATGLGRWYYKNKDGLVEACRLARSHKSMFQFKPISFGEKVLINKAVCKCPVESRIHLMLPKHDCFYFFPNPIHFINGEKHCRILATNHRNLSRLLDDIEENVGNITLERASKFSETEAHYLTLHEIVSEISPKQLEAICHAHAKGYYRYPRKIGLRELARRMKVSKTTYQMHLRKAENKVMHAVVKHLAL